MKVPAGMWILGSGFIDGNCGDMNRLNHAAMCI